MPIPFAEFHGDHLDDGGSRAPNCLIKVLITCVISDCATPPFVVEVVEEQTQTLLASGPVTCKGTPHLHLLSMGVKRPLSAVNVILRYSCGGTASGEEPFSRTIFIVCS